MTKPFLLFLVLAYAPEFSGGPHPYARQAGLGFQEVFAIGCQNGDFCPFSEAISYCVLFPGLDPYGILRELKKLLVGYHAVLSSLETSTAAAMSVNRKFTPEPLPQLTILKDLKAGSKTLSFQGKTFQESPPRPSIFQLPKVLVADAPAHAVHAAHSVHTPAHGAAQRAISPVSHIVW